MGKQMQLKKHFMVGGLTGQSLQYPSADALFPYSRKVASRTFPNLETASIKISLGSFSIMRFS